MAQIVSTGSSFIWLLCISDILLLLQGWWWWWCLFCVNTSFLSSTTRCFRLILYILLPNPYSAIYPKNPGSFYWGMVLEVNIWAFSVLAATGISFLLGLFIWHSKKKIWVNTNLCMYIYLYISFMYYSKHELIPMKLITTWIILASFLCLFVNSCSKSE